MEFVLPSTDMSVQDNQVLLQWLDSDPDSSATISLFYHYQGDRVLIASGLSEDADGEGDQYLWDTSELLPGNYTLSAVISDEESEVEVSLCCTITIEQQSAKTITVTPLQPLVTNEQGAQDVIVDIQLDEPLLGTDTLTLNFSVSNAGEAQIIGNGFAFFDASNWNQPQRLRIRGVDDCLFDENRNVELVF